MTTRFEAAGDVVLEVDPAVVDGACTGVVVVVAPLLVARDGEPDEHPARPSASPTTTTATTASAHRR